MKTSITAGEPVIRSTGKITKEGNVIFMVCEDYVVDYGAFKDTVPKGRLTDFASIPNKWRDRFSSRGVFSGAAVMHDFCYFNGSVSKWEADSRFYQHLLAEKVSKTEAFLMWLGVFLFADKAWKRHRRLKHPTENQDKF